jgi:hypothetical protein
VDRLDVLRGAQPRLQRIDAAGQVFDGGAMAFPCCGSRDRLAQRSVLVPDPHLDVRMRCGERAQLVEARAPRSGSAE